VLTGYVALKKFDDSVALAPELDAGVTSDDLYDDVLTDFGFKKSLGSLLKSSFS